MIGTRPLSGGESIRAGIRVALPLCSCDDCWLARVAAAPRRTWYVDQAAIARPRKDAL